MWVNKFVSAPLPYAVEPVVPPAELGLQLRNGLQWGALGQDLDYTVYVGQGPGYSANVPGAVSTSPVAIASKQTNGKSFGGRFRVYPFPIDANLGRLEVGVSSYDGKWLDGKWLTSWGVDFAYCWAACRRVANGSSRIARCPPPSNKTIAKAGIVQLGYLPQQLNLPGVPDDINNYVHRLEPSGSLLGS